MSTGTRTYFRTLVEYSTTQVLQVLIVLVVRYYLLPGSTLARVQ